MAIIGISKISVSGSNPGAPASLETYYEQKDNFNNHYHRFGNLWRLSSFFKRKKT